jgi:hypothetical protein
MSFILGIFIGFCVSLLAIVQMDRNKEQNVFSHSDMTGQFDEGVSYGLMMNRENGAIIAVNDDEIMVQYDDGTTKRFREVTDE